MIKKRLEKQLKSENTKEVVQQNHIEDFKDNCEEILNNVTNKTTSILDKFENCKSFGKSRDIGKGAAAMSVVNSKNGMRVTLGAEVYRRINSPDKIQIAFSIDEIAVFESLPENENYFKPRITGKSKKVIIYSADLVREITDKYGLEFNNKVSYSFYDVRYVTENDITIALIKVKK
ncbi:hypothetical protein SAMN02745135_02139 [Caloranaerobacter azorensis DSM 13643]|uniref:Uncharacterized protein n=1 Tax=Caloranaerobacter azorensis DSM 13643 TaxID=1121264 RepID=A0A1M5VUQ6_9FIRM|nr:hypothetical protein [Caloranaerobacter azorensis]SHH78937.1 hypothetical protein SAMN02745135_02139 [Caloranaerobacter azorensis DSM 13643]